MNKIITHLDLDLASSNEYKVINAQQLDNNTRRLEVNLFHEGKIYDITNVTKIELQGFRGDGETIKTPLTNDGNNIIVDFDNTILGAKGICKLKIALFGEDNKLLSSFPFVIRIDQNVYDETGVIASPVYLELENELKNIEKLKNEIETNVSNFILKEDKDVAGGVPSLDSNTKVPIAELYEATTTRKGITQLTDSVTSASTTTAATPNSVKAVNDSLNSEISRAKSAESTLTTNLNAEITRAKNAENTLSTNKLDKTTVATSSTLGLVKSGTDITVDSLGNVSVNDNSHKHTVSNISDLTATASELNVLDGITATTQELNYVDGVTSNIQTQLNSKSTNGHTHDDRYYTESEVDTTVSNINNSISSHTGNTSNPHSVTKAQVGLGNVENKSSATIRGEITKSDVTTALGYTPYTPNEIDNKFSALETNIDWKESVSTFDDIATTYPNPIDGWTVNVKDTDYTYRYNGASWVAISANAIPKATNNVDGLLSKEDHTNYEDANSKKHTHSNKSVIDGISSTNVSDWNSAKTHADSTHARTDATKVEKSSTNGNIKINGTETTVYTHPSGTNPHGTTKSDVGLGNVGDFKAVSTVANQGLSDTEKSNARANIGAGTSSFSGSYNDLSNKPTIPTNNSQLTNDAGYITSSGTAKTISDTLPISKGGTGQTTGINAANTLINSLSTGDSTPTDADYYISQYVGGGTTTTTYHRRPMSSLWNYIKSKLATVATSGSYNDLSNKPTIPTVGNGTVTIKQAGTSKGSFTMNQSGNTTIELTDNNTWRDIQNNLTSDSTTDSLSAAQGKVLKDLIDDKAASSHTHSKSQITDFPTSLPASDVYSWAKESTKPSYTASEVGLGNVPNVDTNDQTPSYTEATTLAKLTSGEKLSVAFGKISKAITDLISHIGDSVKHITSTERTNWNSAKTHADSLHAPSNAQANVIETVKVNGTALTPSSKAVDITVPSSASDIGALPISDKNGVEVETPTTFNNELSVSKSLNIFKDSFTNMDFSFNDSNSIPYWNYFDGESEKKLYHPNKSGTIATTDDIKNTDTKNTAGSTNTSSKIYLVGATSQDTNPQTYSHDTAYVGTDGCLYSNSTKVSVEGHTHDVSQITGLNYYDASLQRTANTILAAPNGSNGAATFRKLVESDLPNHTHNYAGAAASGGAAYSANKIYLPRVAKSCSYQPGNNVGIWEEFTAGASYNLPDNAWYHIFTGQGSDPNYNTQLALGVTYEQVAYRCRQSGTWGSWKELAFTDRTATYEEGTWTPTNGNSSNPDEMDTSVYKFKHSEYKKIGKVVILTTTATPTNAEEKTADLVICRMSFPFNCETFSAFSADKNGSKTSIGKHSIPYSTINFGSYTFVGYSSGLTDVNVTIICSL